jgi:hypothetical protein
MTTIMLTVAKAKNMANPPAIPIGIITQIEYYIFLLEKIKLINEESFYIVCPFMMSHTPLNEINKSMIAVIDGLQSAINAKASDDTEPLYADVVSKYNQTMEYLRIQAIVNAGIGDGKDIYAQEKEDFDHLLEIYARLKNKHNQIMFDLMYHNTYQAIKMKYVG